jgi:hypothetical protein
MVSTRATPTVCSKSATTLAEIGTREDHDHQFHQVFIGGVASRLHHKNVAGTDVLVDFNSDFAVRETTNISRAQFDA